MPARSRLRHAYCTVFDRNYAPRALALYRSLARWDPGAQLFAVCMDRESEELFGRLGLPSLTAIGIDEVERSDPALAAVRRARTPVEYAWTAVSAACRFLLEREGDPELETLTYLDTDLLLHGSPQPLFDELGDGSILLVPHRMDAREELVQGRFNVGWITFRRDPAALAAVEWWRERCLEWCHDRVEPGRFGDQKYLDEWPSRFDGVRVSANPAAGLGPWNQTRHRFEVGGGGELAADGQPVVFFHYSGVSLHPGAGRLAQLAVRSGVYRRAGPLVWTIRARHRRRALDVVWGPYAERCAAAHADLAAAGASREIGLQQLTPRAVAAAVSRERAPARARDLHLALRRVILARRAVAARPG
jgi:hypothetical protein